MAKRSQDAQFTSALRRYIRLLTESRMKKKLLNRVSGPIMSGRATKFDALNE
jgi:hypothetical protein